jgi:hypothetical protein
MAIAFELLPLWNNRREHRRLYVNLSHGRKNNNKVNKSLSTRNRALRALPLALLSMLLVFSCSSPVLQKANEAGTGVLSISIGEVASKTLLPSIDMKPAVYDISGTGPQGKFFSQTITSGTAQVPGLYTGQWTITVSEKNQALQGIGQGSGNVTIQAQQTATLAISVKPLAGNGTVSLTVLLPPGLVAPSITGSLAPSSGTTIPLTFVLGPSSATCVNSTIPSGYYTLSVKLSDSSTLLASAVDVARVVNGATTSGSVDFSAVVAPTSPVNVSITQSLNDPIVVTLQGGLSPLALGTSMTVTATASPSGGLFAWYLDGSAIAPTTSSGPTVIIPGTVPAGPHKLDSLVFSTDGLRAGSASFSFVVAAVDASTAGSYTFGVWLQSPTRTRNGLANAVNYKNLGINSFMGLWSWPDESWAYPGYSLQTAQSLQANGMKAYAGDTQAAVTWNSANPGFASTFVGYLLGDEPDMNKVSGLATLAAASMPDAWMASGTAMATADPSRSRYTNFGKGFALDPWNGYHVDAGSTQLLDFQKYVSPNTMLSADFYGITDPYETLSKHGIWTYGQTVTNVLKYAGTRPVWGFVEASAAFPDSNYGAGATNFISRRMLPQYIAPAVWNMVVHGASGIVYFCHDFSNGGAIEDGLLNEPGMPAAVSAANASVSAYGAVLATPSIAGATATSSGAVPVTLLVKRYGTYTYVFAMGDGNSSNIYGQAVTAQITIPGAPTGTVQVLSDGRTLPMTSGSFSDHFNAYELHIYKF